MWRTTRIEQGMHTLDIITVAQSTELFLARCIPYIESDLPSVCVENQRMHLDTQCRCKR